MQKIGSNNISVYFEMLLSLSEKEVQSLRQNLLVVQGQAHSDKNLLGAPTHTRRCSTGRRELQRRGCDQIQAGRRGFLSWRSGVYNNSSHVCFGFVFGYLGCGHLTAKCEFMMNCHQFAQISDVYQRAEPRQGAGLHT